MHNLLLLLWQVHVTFVTNIWLLSLLKKSFFFYKVWFTTLHIQHHRFLKVCWEWITAGMKIAGLCWCRYKIIVNELWKVRNGLLKVRNDCRVVLGMGPLTVGPSVCVCVCVCVCGGWDRLCQLHDSLSSHQGREIDSFNVYVWVREKRVKERKKYKYRKPKCIFHIKYVNGFSTQLCMSAWSAGRKMNEFVCYKYIDQRQWKGRTII